MSEEPKRIEIIPFLHGYVAADGKLIEPDIYRILEKWLERHPDYRGREREFRISRAAMRLPNGVPTERIRVLAEASPSLADYNPAEDTDLYKDFVTAPDLE